MNHATHSHDKRRTPVPHRARDPRQWSVATASEAERADDLIESLEASDSDARFVPDWSGERVKHAA